MAGTVGGVADLVFGKLAVTAGVEDNLGKVPSAISKILGGAGTEFTAEYHEKKLANYGTQFLGTDPEEGAAAEGLTAAVAGGTGSSTTAATDLVSSEKDVLEDAQGEFETIDPSPSKPLSPTYTPPDAPKTVDKKPSKPSLTPEAVTSEDISVATKMLEDAGIKSKDLQQEILDLAGLTVTKEPSISLPTTTKPTAPTTAPTTATDTLIDPGKRIPKTVTSEATISPDATTDTTTAVSYTHLTLPTIYSV